MREQSRQSTQAEGQIGEMISPRHWGGVGATASQARGGAGSRPRVLIWGEKQPETSTSMACGIYPHDRPEGQVTPLSI